MSMFSPMEIEKDKDVPSRALLEYMDEVCPFNFIYYSFADGVIGWLNL